MSAVDSLRLKRNAWQHITSKSQNEPSAKHGREDDVDMPSAGVRTAGYSHTPRTNGRLRCGKPRFLENVREIRERHAAKFNYDLDAICRDLKEQKRKSVRKIVSFPAKKPSRRAKTDRRESESTKVPFTGTSLGGPSRRHL